jgi:hypothetical protein
MIFAAFGFIEPAAGAILQEGIDVIVILNALRAGHPPSATSTPDPPVPAAVAERRAVLENLWGANIKEE